MPGKGRRGRSLAPDDLGHASSLQNLQLFRYTLRCEPCLAVLFVALRFGQGPIPLAQGSYEGSHAHVRGRAKRLKTSIGSGYFETAF